MRKTITHMVVVAALAGGFAGSAVAPASASSATVVYTQGMAGFWNRPEVRPGEIVFGALYGVRYLTWQHWWPRNAYGRGQYFLWGGPGTKYVRYRASVHLYDVGIHRGQKFFAWISVSARGHKTVRLSYHGYWRTRT